MAAVRNMRGVNSSPGVAKSNWQSRWRMAKLHLHASMQVCKCRGAHRHLQDDVDGVAYSGVQDGPQNAMLGGRRDALRERGIRVLLVHGLHQAPRQSRPLWVCIDLHAQQSSHYCWTV